MPPLELESHRIGKLNANQYQLSKKPNKIEKIKSTAKRNLKKKKKTVTHGRFKSQDKDISMYNEFSFSVSDKTIGNILRTSENNDSLNTTDNSNNLTGSDNVKYDTQVPTQQSCKIVKDVTMTCEELVKSPQITHCLSIPRSANKEKDILGSIIVSPKKTSLEDQCLLSNWGLPDGILKSYQKYGITTMFTWQVECLCLGNVLQGQNLVYSAPTSAGKTLVAEILILKKVLEYRKKAIMILPFISLAREKMCNLQNIFSNVGIRVDGYMGSHHPPGGFCSVDIAVCTIEKANSLVNRLLEDKNLDDLGIVVVDELHLLGDSHRGYLLELLLTKVLYYGKRSGLSVQIIGLSATLPNLDFLANWLAAELYHTTFRPVPLKEFIKIGDIIYDSKTFQEIRCLKNINCPIQNDSDHVIFLSLETVLLGHSVLIFCPTKNWCERLAETIAKEVFRIGSSQAEAQVDVQQMCKRLREVLDGDKLSDVLAQLKNCSAGLDAILARTVAFGVAFHHAGLTFDERDIIEGAFRQGIVKVLIATSTLSSGVNLPARRVIIRSLRFHGTVIDVLMYKQMAGRAGRKGVDSEGESIILCKESEHTQALALVKSDLRPIKSCLVRREDNSLCSSMKRAILEIIASGIASSPEEVNQYASCTLLMSSVSKDSSSEINNAVISCVQYLEENEFIHLQTEENDGEMKPFYQHTQFGQAVLASALSPDEGLRVLKELHQARKCFVLENELHILYQVTPPYLSDQFDSLDWLHFLFLWEQLSSDMKHVGELVGVEERFITKGIQGRISTSVPKQARLLALHKRFYIALALNELVQEKPITLVSSKYKCSRGMLQSLQQSAATFAGMVTVFCNRLGWHNLELLVSQFHKRLFFGIQRELCDLVRLTTLNIQYARALYNGGYETVALLANADPHHIELLIRNIVPFKSDKQEEGETSFEFHQRRKAKSIWVTGHKGLTEWEASLLIVKEAKCIVQKELGVDGVIWQHVNKDINPNITEVSHSDTKHKSSTEDKSKDNNLIIFENNTSKKYVNAEESLTNTSSFSTKQNKIMQNNVNKSQISYLESDINQRQESEKHIDCSLPNSQYSKITSPELQCTLCSKVSLCPDNLSENKKLKEHYIKTASEVSLCNFSKIPKFIDVKDITLINSTEKNRNISNILDCSYQDDIQNMESIYLSTSLETPSKNSLNICCKYDAKQKQIQIDIADFEKILHDLNKSRENTRDGFITKAAVAAAIENFSRNSNQNIEIRNTKVKSLSKTGIEWDDSFEVDSYTEKILDKETIQTYQQNDLDKKVESEKSNIIANHIYATQSLQCTNVSFNSCHEKTLSDIQAPQTLVNLCGEKENKSSSHESSLNSLQERENMSLHLNDQINVSGNKNKENDSKSITCSQELFNNSSDNVKYTELKCRPNSNDTSFFMHNKFESDFSDDSHLNEMLNMAINMSTEEEIGFTPTPSDLFTVQNHEIKIHEHMKYQDCTSGTKEKTKFEVNTSLTKNYKESVYLKCPVTKYDSSELQTTDAQIKPICSNEKILLSPLQSSTPNSSFCVSSSSFKEHESTNKVPEVLPNNTNSFQSILNDSSLEQSSTSDCISPTPPKNIQISKLSHQTNSRNKSKMNNNVLMTDNLTISTDLNYCASETETISNFKPNCLQSLLQKGNKCFNIIDVASNQELFYSFLTLWKKQNKFSFVVATEKQLATHIDGIGSKMKAGSTYHQTVKNQSEFHIMDADSHVTGIAVCWEDKTAFYLPLLVTETYGQHGEKHLQPLPSDLSLSTTVRFNNLRKILEQELRGKKIITIDLKEQYKALCCGCGIILNEENNIIWEDPIIAEWLLDPASGQKTLHALIAKYMPQELSLFHAFGKTRKYGSLGLASGSRESGRLRAATEAVLVFHLMEKLWPHLKEKHLEYSFSELEMPTLLILAKMEQNGMGFDSDMALHLHNTLQDQLEILKVKAYHLAGRTFSLSSPHEIAKVLYKELNLPPGGNPCNSIKPLKNLSTSKEALEKLKNLHDLPGVILDWRKVSSALRNVVIPLLRKKILNQLLKMDRIHGNWDVFTATGRIIMHDPNIQFVPKDFDIINQECDVSSPMPDEQHPLVFSLRNAFIPFKGGVILSADYTQMELRILAHLSGDAKLQKMLKSGGDVFKSIAAHWKGIALNSVSEQERQQAKQICYGMIYGMTSKTLADHLKVDDKTATSFITTFKNTYPGVEQYLKSVVDLCRKNGYVVTLSGRQRYLPNINNSSSFIQAQAERQAINTTIQGSAADLSKIAMIKIDRDFQKYFPETRKPHRLKHDCRKKETMQPLSFDPVLSGGYIILHLHDELIYEVTENDVNTVACIVKKNMETAMILDVDIPVKIKVGKTWSTLTHINI